MLSALDAITRPSVYLSVCQSVTRVDQSKWPKLGLRSFQHTIPLVFASYKFHPEILMGSPDLAVRQGKVWKQAIGDIGFYLGHEFHILGSRNVVGHMTIRLGIGHFYW